MEKQRYKIVMPYIGGILTDNQYKFLSKRNKPIVTMWKRELAAKVEALEVPKAESFEIRLRGFFPDERRPDLSNLHKVIGDALKKTTVQAGLGIDDKFFFFVDVGYQTGKLDPELEIEIVPGIRKE